MLQFIKGPWKSGEDNKEVWPEGFELRKGGLGFVGILGDKLPLEKHIEAAGKTLGEAFSELNSGGWDMIILDEVNVALDLDLIELRELRRLIDEAHAKKIDLVFTGRGAVKEIIERADIVSEVRDVKHVFEKGVKARKGLDY